MTTDYFVGVDVGTSGAKTVLFDGDGRAVCSKTVEYPLFQPRNGWAEQDPEHWWRAVAEGISFVTGTAVVAKERIRGVGVSGQMHGLVMLDREGRVLRNAIIWCDQRTAAECDEINRLVGEKRLAEITANPALTGFTASKILWVRAHEPHIYEKCAHILLPKDYIRYRLTGVYATEVSDASGMQLMDVAGRRWSGEVLDKLRIDRALLPDMHESPDVTGAVHKRAAEATGLAEGAVVVGGAGDNAAAAVGMGVVREGQAFVTIGSSGVIYAVTDSLSVDMGGRVNSLCASVPGKWTVMSCTQAAGLSLKWLRDTCCLGQTLEAEKRGADPYAVMGELAESAGTGAGGLLYLPYLMGERAPHPDPDCRGVFFGLSAMHGAPHMIRAVMEGVAFSQWECVDVFKEMGISISDMLVCGGGGRSPLWRQMLADMAGCAVSASQTDEGPALGAAILAMVGAGRFAGVEEGCGHIVKRFETNKPDPASRKAYEGYYALYKKLYTDLRENFQTLAKLVKGNCRVKTDLMR